MQNLTFDNQDWGKETNATNEVNKLIDNKFSDEAISKRQRKASDLASIQAQEIANANMTNTAAASRRAGLGKAEAVNMGASGANTGFQENYTNLYNTNYQNAQNEVQNQINAKQQSVQNMRDQNNTNFNRIIGIVGAALGSDERCKTILTKWNFYKEDK